MCPALGPFLAVRAKTSWNGAAASRPYIGCDELDVRRRRRGQPAKESRDLPGEAKAACRSARRSCSCRLQSSAGTTRACRRKRPPRLALATSAMPAGVRVSRRNRPANGKSNSPRSRHRPARGEGGQCRAPRAAGKRRLSSSHSGEQVAGLLFQSIALPHAGRLDHEIALFFQVGDGGDNAIARLANRAAHLLQIEREPRAPFTAWRNTSRRNAARWASNCPKISCELFCG